MTQTKKIMQNKQGNRISMTVMSVKTKELNEKATKNKKKGWRQRRKTQNNFGGNTHYFLGEN